MTTAAESLKISVARPPGVPSRGALALALQEAFTAAARLRANRQVAADADAFRVQIKQLLARADVEARQAGYDPNDVRLAIYGFVAFLDESVLNSGQAMFAAWPRQPLQEEIFGDHRGGQTFFVNMDELLARPDTEQVADTLEVYQLCLLLGFRGRYGAEDDGGLRTRVEAVRRKIERIRGEATRISPVAALPADEDLPRTRDPWLRRLMVVVGVLLVLAVVLFVIFGSALGREVDELRALSSQLLS